MATKANSSIFIGNVPYDADENELKEIFQKVGPVTSVRIVHDKDTKQPKGYAFCDFQDSSSVQTALKECNNAEYNGRRLRVDLAERELHQLEGASKLPSANVPVMVPPPRPPPMSLPAAGGPPMLALPGVPLPGSHGGHSFPPSLPMPSVPVPSVADRLARIREHEEAEKARQEAADRQERAEIACLVETLTPLQAFHVIGEMQRLAVRCPEVAKALIAENLQLALALQHAQYLVGMTQSSPLPTDPDVTQTAKVVAEFTWGHSEPNLGQPHEGAGASPSPGSIVVPPTMFPGGVVVPPTVQRPGPYSRAPSGPALPARPSQAQALPPALAALDLSSLAPGAQGSSLLERLVQLTPQEIDKLPHNSKVQLLEFLQQQPAA